MASNKELKGATASLFELLDGREKDLQKWEEDLNRRESLLQAASNGAKPDDILSLNVGGRTGISVHRKTLTLIENSVLGAMFSKNWEDGLDKDPDGNFFIDQDPDLFITLLNFLRTKANDVRDQGVLPPPETREFDILLDFYDMKLGVYPVEIKQVEGDAASVTLSNYPTFSIESANFYSFDLIPLNHDRLIRSFKIVIGAFSRLHIGWRLSKTTIAAGGSVGTAAGSIAIQIAQERSILLGAISGRLEPSLDPVSEGSTISFMTDASARKQEDRFRYSVLNEGDDAGAPVWSSLYSVGDEVNFCPWIDVVPCITVQGQVQVLEIDY